MLPQGFFLGLIVFQLLFTIIQLVTFRRKEYLWYIFYITALFLYFWFKYLSEADGIVRLGSLAFNFMYTDKTLSMLSYGLYILFGRTFLDTALNYKKFDAIFRWLQQFLFFYVAADFILLLVTGDFQLQLYIFSVIFFAVFIASVFLLIRMLSFKHALDRFLISGSIAVATGACLTLLVGLFQADRALGRNDNVYYFQIGAIIEFIFLNFGLGYKSRKMQEDTINAQAALIQELKHKEAISRQLFDIRSNISRDLHDEIGSSLSGISLFSQMAGKKISENKHDEAFAYIQKIDSYSQETIENMGDIVWTISPEYASTGSILNKLRNYALRLTAASDISLRFQVEETAVQCINDIQQRKNIYLISKEAIHNAVKYSAATEIRYTVTRQENLLQVQISDNGKGFDPATLTSGGNGLKNMRKRAEEIEAELTINESCGKGTTIILRCNTPN